MNMIIHSKAIHCACGYTFYPIGFAWHTVIRCSQCGRYHTVMPDTRTPIYLINDQLAVTVEGTEDVGFLEALGFEKVSRERYEEKRRSLE